MYLDVLLLPMFRITQQVHLNQRKELMASHEDHHVSSPYAHCFEGFWMVTQCAFYMVPGISKAQPLPPQFPSSLWVQCCIHTGAVGTRDGKGEERRLCGVSVAMNVLHVLLDSPNVVTAE